MHYVTHYIALAESWLWDPMVLVAVSEHKRERDFHPALFRIRLCLRIRIITGAVPEEIVLFFTEGTSGVFLGI